MPFALVKTVCGGGILLAKYNQINFPHICAIKILNLSSICVSLSAKNTNIPDYARMDKVAHLNLSFFSEYTPTADVNSLDEIPIIKKIIDNHNEYEAALKDTTIKKKIKTEKINNTKNIAKDLAEKLNEIIRPIEYI